MPIPEALRGRLRLPAVAAPMFLTSGPDLVVECCRAGRARRLPGAEPAQHRRLRRLDGRDRRPARRRAAGRALGGQPDRPPLEPAARRRPRGGRSRHRVPVVITSLGAVRDLVGGGARLRRPGLPRRDLPPPRREGGRGRGRRHHRRLRRGRRPRRHAEPLRARRRDPPGLRRHHPARRRALDRRAHPRGAGARRRPRLPRHPLHRHPRGAGARGAEADDARRPRRRHRLHPGGLRGPRQLPAPEPRRRRPRPRRPAAPQARPRRRGQGLEDRLVGRPGRRLDRRPADRPASSATGWPPNTPPPAPRSAADLRPSPDAAILPPATREGRGCSATSGRTRRWSAGSGTRRPAGPAS